MAEQNNSQLHGSVVRIEGNAWIKLADGRLIPLKPGDHIQEGQTIVTGHNAHVEIALPDGHTLALGGDRTVTTDHEVMAQAPVEKADAALLQPSDAEAQKVIAALNKGDDPFAAVDPTAAGLVAGGASDGGHSFVRLLRISESVGPENLTGTTAASPSETSTTHNGDAVAVATSTSSSTSTGTDGGNGSGTGTGTTTHAGGDTATTSEDHAVVISVTGNDTTATGSLNIVAIDGQPINIGTPVSTSHGSVALNGDGTLTFTPTPNYNGQADFSYTVSDGQTQSTATVAVTVTPVNDAPVSSNQTVTTQEDTPVSGTITATDVDGDTLSYAKGSDPAHGSVAVNADGTWTYTPAANYNGSDSFTVTVSDGNGGTTTSTITVGITPVNDAPTTSNQTVTTAEDTPVSGTITATDVDGDTLSYTKGSDPAHGSVAVNADGTWTYTPAANYNGGDSFTVTVSDSNGGTTTSTITVGITPVNDAPVTSNQTVTTAEDTPVSGAVTATDVDGDTLSYAKGSDPAHGSVAVNTDGTWTYTPAANYNGSDSFTVTVSDSNGGTTTSTITVGITPVNDAAVIAGQDAGAVKEDTSTTATGTLTVTDPDAGEAAFQAQTNVAGAHGSFSIDASGNWTYTLNNSDPAVQSLGEGKTLPAESFTVQSIDGTTHTVTVSITGTNDAASISGTHTGAVSEDTNVSAGQLSTSGTLTVADVDTGEAVFQAQNNVTGSNGYGSFSIDASGHWSYTADNSQSAIQQLGAGQTLTDSITVTSADGTATQVITVTLNGTNDAAVITPATVNLTETNAVLSTGGTLSITDVDAGQASFVAQNNVAGSNGYGHFTLNANGAWTYTTDTAHNEFFAGQTYTDTLTVTSADGTTSTITVNILGTNDAAVITPATVNLTETNAVLTTSGTLAISDVDSSATFVAQNNVAGSNGYGHFTLGTNGAWTYTTDAAHNEFVAGQTYTDTLTVTSADGTTSTITVNILGTNDAAVITPAVANLTETNAVLTTGGTLAITDVDSPATFVAQNNVAGSNGYGHFTLGTNGAWTYTTDTAHNEFVAGQTYTDTLTVTSADGTTSTITVNILGTNDLPVTNPTAASGNEDTTIAVTLSGSDIDGSIGGYVIGNLPAHGTLYSDAALTHAIAAGDTVSGSTVYFKPDANWNGNTSFDYAAQDNNGGVDATPATASIAVAAVNDAPVAVVDAAITPINTALTHINVLGNDTDVDGDTLSVTAAAVNAAQGSVNINADGTLDFTPATNFSGAASITYSISDGHGGTSSSTLTITVGSDTPPDSADTTVTINEDSALTLSTAQFAFSDADAGQTLAAVRIDSLPAAGTLTLNGTAIGADTVVSVADINAGHLVYTPNANGNGNAYASIGFSVQDSAGGFDTTPNTVTVNVTPVNDAAVIAGQDTGAVKEDVTTSASGTLTVTDPDAGEAAFQAQTNVVGAHGSFSIDASGNWTYTLNNSDPAVQALGEGKTLPAESFTVQSIDGTTHTVTVGITGTNDAAVITPATESLTETNAVLSTGGTLAITDVDTGEASFVAQNDVAGSNGYGHFTLGTNGAWTYTTDSAHNEFVAGQTYIDTLTVTSADGTTSTITVNILGTNDAAVITPATVNLTETNAVLSTSGTLAISDVDGSATFVAQNNVAGSNGYGHFTLGTNGAWTYTTDTAHNEFVAGQTYTDTLTVTSADGTTSTITVNILGTNDAAVITPAAVNLTETNAVLTTSGTLAITDVDSPATFVAQNNVAGSNGYGHFTLGTNGAWTYTTDSAHNEFVAGQTYTDTLTVTSADGTTSTITVNILGTNDAAVITPATVNLTETNAVLTTSGTLAISDVDSSATFVAQNNVAGSNGYGHFTLGTNGVWTYTTDTAHNEFVAGQTYTDTLTVTSADGTTSTITVNILGTNDAPVAVADTASTSINTALTSINVLANDTDIDGGALSVTAASVNAAQGTVSINADGTLAFTPATNFSGAASINYSISDGDGGTSSATLTVNVGANTPPESADASVTTHEDTPVALGAAQFAFSDADAGQTLAAVRIDSLPAAGTLTLNGSAVSAGQVVSIADIDAGHLVFTPAANANGNAYASLTFSVQDSAGAYDTTPNTLTLNVTPVADPAVIAGQDAGAVKEDSSTTATGTLTVTDPDTGEAAFQTQTNVAGAHGSFSIDASGNWTYTLNNSDPAVQALGEGKTLPAESFTVQSIDGTTHTITVSITGTNDAASISGTHTGAVSEDTNVSAGQLSTSGTLTVSDVDTGEAVFQAQNNVAGSNGYGNFSIDASGHWSYTADNGQAAIQQLGAGQTLTDSITVTSADGTATQVITVTLNGSNDAAVITPATVNLTETNAVLTTSGTLAISDTDAGQASFVAQTNVAGSNGYGHFTLGTNGAWTYTTDTAHNEFVAGQTYTDTLTVTSADGTTSTITVNILGTNDAAVITPAVANLTETNAVLTTSGTLAITDVDSSATFVAQNNVAGSNGYGHFTLGNDGGWTYATNTAHNEFVAGQTYTDTLTVTSVDGTTSTITVNILGTNDAAVITPATVNLTETDAVLHASGTLSIGDVDSAATFVAQTNVAGSNGYGHFTLGTNGAWTYTTDTAHNEFVAGQTYTDTLTVTSADGTTSTITVNILGTNDAAVITPATVNLTETNAVLSTSGTLAISDVDSPSTFAAQANVAGSNGYGHFTLGSDGSWTYTTDTTHNEFVAGQTYTDTLAVTSADGTTSTITVNILGTNDAAVITPAAVNLTETNAVLSTGGTLAITDVDSSTTFVAQSNVAGSNGYGHFTLGTNGAWTYTTDTAHNEFVAGQTYTDTLTVTSADGTTSTITVNILGTNDAAVITPATVNLTETNAVLSTSGTLAITDVDSSATFVAQTNVAGSNGYGHFTLGTNGAWTYTTDTAHNEFVAGQTYTDTLTVTSADGTASTITVNILGTNDAPTTNDTATRGNEDTTIAVPLSGSDADGSVVAYVIGNLPANGTLYSDASLTHAVAAGDTVSGNTLYFKPDANWNGNTSFQYAAQDNSGAVDTTPGTANIQVIAQPDPAVIAGQDTGAVKEDSSTTAAGTLTVTDPDTGEAAFQAQTNVVGAHGSFSIDASGNWTYTLNNSDPAVQALGEGKTLPAESFTVQSIDGTTHTVTVSITGTNDAAVITPTTVNLTETNAVLSTGGTLAITDVDTGEATFVAQNNVAGSNGYGHFTLGTNGVWSYTTDTAHNEFVAGQTYTDTLTVTSADGTTSTITVNILGTNDAAVITPATVNLTETNAVLTTSGTLAISDVDSSATFVAQNNVAGSNGYGHFTLGTNGAWTYTTDTAHNEFVAGQTYTDTLAVTSADGTTSTITVNILGTNDAAVITPAVANMTETNAVLSTSGTLAISDVDSSATFVAQNNVAGSNGYGHFTLGTNGAWTYTTDTAHNEFVAGQTYTDTLTVTSADGTTSTITVNILGTNDAAVITPAVANLTETNAVLSTSGTLSITDIDSAATFFAQNNVVGSNGYGHFTLNTNGAWTYTTDTAHNEFVAGQTYTDKLAVTSADGTTSTITVNILGTNDAAVITPAVANLTETNAILSTSGTLSITDVDSPATFVAQNNVAGSNGYGHFTLGTNGAWTYTTDTAHNEFVAGQTYTDTLTVTSADGTTSTITVNILGTNDAAVITPAVANLTETNAVLTTSGTLAISDVDSPATFVAQNNVAGSNGYGHFTLGTNGAWSYTTDTAHNEFVAGQTYTDTLTVTSADGTTRTITVNILGTNDAAVITPAVANLTETNAVLSTSGTLSISDVDSAATFVAQNNVAGSNGYGHFTLGTNGAWTYTTDTAHNEFVAGQTYTDTLTVTSADGTTSTITVNILGTNDAAVITPAVANLTETNAVLTTNGTLAITDVDSPATFVAQNNVAGSNGYGHFTLGTNGAWTYTTDSAHNEFVAGQTYTDTLTVTSADGTSSTITVNILGTNDAAVITPAIANLTETNAVLSTSGTLAITDVDSPATFVAQNNVAGSNGYGHFTLGTNGAWSYTTDTAHNEFVAGQTYTDTLIVTSADGTTSTITVNILGTNDAAVITPAVANLTETNAVLSTSGTLAISDVDSPATFVAQNNVAGSNGYGHFTLGTNGAWTYATDTAHNEFVAGQTYTDTLTITSADGTTSTITVNILGTNDAAVITPAVANLTETNAVLSTSGTLAITDVDSSATFVAQNNVAGSNGYGHFTLGTNGVWSYTTDTAHNEFVAGQTYTDTLTVTSADGTTSTITVNILGTNDAAVITPATVNLTETNAVLTTSGTLAISDVDSSSTFVAQNNVAGSNGYGHFTLGTNGAWSYTTDTAHNEFVAGQTYTDKLTVTSADGTTSTITVNILGTNDAAVITPATVNLTETNAVLSTSGTLAISDVDSSATFVAQTNVAGSNGYGHFTLGTNGAWTYTTDTAHNEFVAGQTYTDKLTVTSADGTTSTITVNILGTDDAPVASGGAVIGTEDTALALAWSNFGISDVDSASSSLSVTITSLPADGTLQYYNGSAWVAVTAGQELTKASIDAGNLRFVPDANESGSNAYSGSGVGNMQSDYAHIGFAAGDGSATSSSATLAIDITPVADTPTLSHNASTSVSSSIEPAATGLMRDYFQAIPTIASGPMSTNPDTMETGIDATAPTSSATITNVGVAGNATSNGVQIAVDDAYHVQGLVYLEAGKSYTFSGYADDTVRLEIGGNTLVSGQWGSSGQASAGTFTATTFTPTESGYYSLEFMVYNTSGPGSYDLNVSVNGGTAVDVSTSNMLLYQSINEIDAAGGQHGLFVANSTTGEGGYYPVSYDIGMQGSGIHLAPITAALTDTDGSETLALTMTNIPVGVVLSDGAHSFTASGADTSVSLSGWDLNNLVVTPVSSYSGSFTLEVVATSTETANGSTASTTLDVPVTVLAAADGLAATFSADAFFGHAGNDQFIVTENGTGYAVSESIGAYTSGSTSYSAVTGSETSATTDQVFSTGGGNDYVVAGSGNDTLYMGDSAGSSYPGTSAAPTQAQIAALNFMTLTDGSQLNTDGTGTFSNTGLRIPSSTSSSRYITTWADVANGGSGDDHIYGTGSGTHLLYGGTGNDTIVGGSGNDGLRGGAGDDVLMGGAGNDVLRGDAGSDVFKWTLGDQGTAGAPAKDIIMDFSTSTAAGSNDSLDLRDLLQGESHTGTDAGNLSNYLHFEVSGNDTIIHVSSSGAYGSGYASGKDDQTITLSNVDLTNGGALSGDAAIIHDLLNKGKLQTD